MMHLDASCIMHPNACNEVRVLDFIGWATDSSPGVDWSGSVLIHLPEWAGLVQFLIH